MGSVFLCLDLQTNREVILKILNEELVGVGHNTQRFLDEGKKSKKLNHPNIVNVFDYGKDGNTYYIAMEYIKGSTVKDLIKKARASHSYIPLPLVNKILISTLYALSYAKKAGIIAHRDVKSQNIMIDNNGIVKLLDFGNSKAIGFGTYPTRWLTPEYESPEQGFPTKFGNKIDIRSDIYSLGIVMYEMLTNRLPFTGSAGEVSEKHLLATPPNPTKFRKDLPQGLISILYKALEKNPSRRYQTPEEMIRDLQRGYASGYEVPKATQNNFEGVTIPSHRNAKYTTNNVITASVSPSSGRIPYTPPQIVQKKSNLPLIIGGAVGTIILVLFIALLPHTKSTAPLPHAPQNNSQAVIPAHNSSNMNIPSDVSYIYPISDSACYYTKDDFSSLSSNLYFYNGKESKLIQQFPYLVNCIAVSSDGKYIAIAGGKDNAGYPQPVLHIFANGKVPIYTTSARYGNVTYIIFKDENEVLFTASSSNNESDIYLLNIKTKNITPIVSNSHENVFPFLYKDNLYYVDRTKNSELMVDDLSTGHIVGTNLYNVSVFAIADNTLIYTDKSNEDVHTASISGSSISAEKTILKNKDNVTIVRIYTIGNGFYLFQTKNGQYWIEKIKG